MLDIKPATVVGSVLHSGLGSSKPDYCVSAVEHDLLTMLESIANS